MIERWEEAARAYLDGDRVFAKAVDKMRRDDTAHAVACICHDLNVLRGQVRLTCILCDMAKDPRLGPGKPALDYEALIWRDDLPRTALP